MLVRKAYANWEVRAPAKLNLLLEVLAKRDDDFHEIETLMVPINLFDTLYFTSNSTGRVELSCQWARAGPTVDQPPDDFPRGADNLVVRAVELVRQRFGVREGADLRLVKRIPTAAGLGGGSSDAAAALTVANRAWNLQLSAQQLNALAAELGSDVPFFLVGGPAVARGRGERLEPVDRLGRLHLVVAKPRPRLSTGAVFAACRPADKPRHLAPLIDALRAGQLATVGRRLFNRLEEAAATLTTAVDLMRRELEHVGCPGSQMSGSGTSFFALCRHARHARRVAGRLRARGLFAFAACSCR